LISVFRRAVDENCALLGYYTASSGNALPTFRISLTMGQMGCPETSLRNYRSSLSNKPEERNSQYNKMYYFQICSKR